MRLCQAHFLQSPAVDSAVTEPVPLVSVSNFLSGGSTGGERRSKSTTSSITTTTATTGNTSPDPTLLKLARDRVRDTEERTRKWEAAVGAKIVGPCGRAECERPLRRVSDHEFHYQYKCSAGCHLVYHKGCFLRVSR